MLHLCEWMNFDQFLTSETSAFRIGPPPFLRISILLGPEVSCDARLLANFSSATIRAGRASVFAGRMTLERRRRSRSLAIGCGTHRHHQRLEEALARFKQTETPPGFSSGYAAALNDPALAGRTTVILDKLCRLSGMARLRGVVTGLPRNQLEIEPSTVGGEEAPRCAISSHRVRVAWPETAPRWRNCQVEGRWGGCSDEAHGIGVIESRSMAWRISAFPPG
jgi:hypothetical protein